MFEVGNLLYFEPFHFTNGANSKSKYCIILASVDNTRIVASLPTSQDHIPSSIDKEHGCLDFVDMRFNCYYFSNEKIVCDDTKFQFPKDTYLYGEQVDFQYLDLIRENHFGYTGITYKGKFNEEEFRAIKDCFKNSKSVKRGIKKLL